MVLMLLGCLAHTSGLVAPQPVPVDMVAVVDSLEVREVQAAPEALSTRIGALLQARNLPATPVSDWATVFSSRRDTAYRLQWLAGRSGHAATLVLIELQAQYYSQMNGQYRWTVELSATLSDAAQTELALSRSLTIPVFLQYEHQREQDAITAAIPVIEREVGALVDAYLGSQ